MRWRGGGGEVEEEEWRGGGEVLPCDVSEEVWLVVLLAREEEGEVALVEQHPEIVRRGLNYQGGPAWAATSGWTNLDLF